jgi:NADH dehydrogenase
MTQSSIVVVFGGTGFLGRRVVRRLLAHGFQVRVASRHPDRAGALSGPEADWRLQPVQADIDDDSAVAEALEGAYGAVNAVSLYVERGGATFASVHVEAAERLARLARQAGVQRLAHVSGIGSDPASSSLYIRKRGEGELAVRAAFAGALIIRPAVIFGPDDAFLGAIQRLLRRLPVYPLFGDGTTRLQPADVEDVAEGLVRALQRPDAPKGPFEFGGPQVYRYRDLVEAIARDAALTPRLVPVPFGVWRVLAGISELLPNPPLTRNQVELMQVDTVASPEAPGLAALGVSPRSIHTLMRETAAATG